MARVLKQTTIVLLFQASLGGAPTIDGTDCKSSSKVHSRLAVLPTAVRLQHMDDAADHAAVIDPVVARPVRR